MRTLDRKTSERKKTYYRIKLPEIRMLVTLRLNAKHKGGQKQNEQNKFHQTNYEKYMLKVGTTAM